MNNGADDNGFLPESGFTRRKPVPSQESRQNPDSGKPSASPARVMKAARRIPVSAVSSQKGQTPSVIQPDGQKDAKIEPFPAAREAPASASSPTEPRRTPSRIIPSSQAQANAPRAESIPKEEKVPESPGIQNTASPASIDRYSPDPGDEGSPNERTAIHKVVRTREIKRPSGILQSPTKEKKAERNVTTPKSILKALVYIVAVLTVSIILSYVGIIIANDAFAFVKPDEYFNVTIPELTTTSELADILHQEGIIKFPLIFKIYCGRGGKTAEFVAGDYVVNANSSYDELFAQFQKSLKRETVRIAFPEGSTVDEVIALLVENEVGTAEGFKEVINNYDFSEYDFSFMDELEMTPERYYRLEGYLFPDTYYFYKSRGIEEGDGIYLYQDEVNAIVKFLERFDQIFTEDLKLRAEELKMSIDEVVTLASLIEKEGKFVVDFDKISSVFHNRLNNKTYFPMLQSDATIVYAMQLQLGERPSEITGNDLAFNDPYNTYLHPGLPPGAIANPGYNAITCALYPSNTDYYYFVSKKDGTMLFARTEQEHLQNSALIRGE
ncbi:MAG: endolytic transglycosylase MltG [Clostridia bacterium]|nr:endolytic transglycosylase MltG [Clostridia bacterium]